MVCEFSQSAIVQALEECLPQVHGLIAGDDAGRPWPQKARTIRAKVKGGEGYTPPEPLTHQGLADLHPTLSRAIRPHCSWRERTTFTQDNQATTLILGRLHAYKDLGSHLGLVSY